MKHMVIELATSEERLYYINLASKLRTIRECCRLFPSLFLDFNC